MAEPEQALSRLSAAQAIRGRLSFRNRGETSRDRDELAQELADAALEAVDHDGALARAEDAERALGDLLGRLNRLSIEMRSVVLNDEVVEGAS